MEVSGSREACEVAKGPVANNHLDFGQRRTLSLGWEVFRKLEGCRQSGFEPGAF